MGVKSVPLTDEEIEHLCASVTPAQRDFCRANMYGGAQWPEIWLRDNVRKDPSEDMAAGDPYSAAQWWEFINERVTTASRHSDARPE